MTEIKKPELNDYDLSGFGRDEEDVTVLAEVIIRDFTIYHNQELAKANHAKDEALKWYEDVCKELVKKQSVIDKAIEYVSASENKLVIKNCARVELLAILNKGDE